MPPSGEQIRARAKARKMPPLPAPRSRADAALDGDPLYTVKEAASILLITDWGVFKAVRSNLLPAIRFKVTGEANSVTLIRRSRLKNYMEATNRTTSEISRRTNIRYKERRYRAKKKALAAQTASAQTTAPTPSSHEQEKSK